MHYGATSYVARGVVVGVGLMLAWWAGAPVGRAQTIPPVAGVGAGPRAVAGEVLVQFHPGAVEADKASARRQVGGTIIEDVTTPLMKERGTGDLELVRVAPGLGTASAIARLRAHAWVANAEPNWLYEHHAVSTDPYYISGSLWGMLGPQTNPANAFGSQAAAAWANGAVGSSNVYVGIIDEGVMHSHQDLAGNVWTNTVDTPDGVDNDGNGYVDDVHGWDFDGRDNTTYDGVQDDHATHVAGTIGAVGGNGVGVAGVNWQVTMISAKFLGRRGGTTANAIKAVDYITDLKTRQQLNIVATNNSWGGGGFSQALLDAINRAGDAGILFVAAAGNGGSDGVGDNNDATATYPANYRCTSEGKRSYDCVIAVAALSSTGARASFSNYGAATVDIGAPGVGIYSTVPGKSDASAYVSYSGTSMATPHVTGAIALYAARNPSETAASIKVAVLGQAAPTSSMAGRTVTGGRLNVSGF